MTEENESQELSPEDVAAFDKFSREELIQEIKKVRREAAGRRVQLRETEAAFEDYKASASAGNDEALSASQAQVRELMTERALAAVASEVNVAALADSASFRDRVSELDAEVESSEEFAVQVAGLAQEFAAEDSRFKPVHRPGKSGGEFFGGNTLEPTLEQAIRAGDPSAINRALDQELKEGR